jgi:cytidylate kinase
MTLLCLLGRHGSGKSALGRAMAELGYQHISMGLLRRLAASSQFPNDIPVTLMCAMRRARAGQPLSAAITAKLLKHVATLPLCVLDGFPASPGQLGMLAPDVVFGLVWAPAQQRLDRLAKRSASSLRQWTPGLQSNRDAALAVLLARIRSSHRLVFINNSVAGQEALDATALALVARLAGAAVADADGALP